MPIDLVGLKDIADRLDVPRNTVDSWHHRGRLPEPYAYVSGKPAWEWSAIAAWAKETGRLAH